MRWPAAYIAIVFGAGFLLGPIRVLVLEPRFGVRVAELMEAPLMLTVILLTGRWVGRRCSASFDGTCRLGIGLFAAA